MKTRNWTYLLFFLLLLPLRPMVAQRRGAPPIPPSNGDPHYSLTFTRAAGSPGGEAVLPMVFSRHPGSRNLREIRIRFTYPKSVIQYAKVEDTAPARRADLQIKVQEGKTAREQDTVDLLLILPNSQDTNFPTGQLAVIHFSISPDAKDGRIALAAELWIEGRRATAENHLARVEQPFIEVAAPAVQVGRLRLAQ